MFFHCFFTEQLFTFKVGYLNCTTEHNVVLVDNGIIITQTHNLIQEVALAYAT